MEERRVHGAKELLSSIQLKSQSLYLGRIGCLRASEVTIGYVTSCLRGSGKLNWGAGLSSVFPMPS